MGHMYEDKPEAQDRTLHRFPKESTVYVFEDFDCMSDVFMDRKLKEKEKEKEDTDKKADKEKSSLLEEMLMIKQMESMHRMHREKKKRKKRLEKKRKAKEASENKNKEGKTEEKQEKKEDDKPEIESSDSDDGLGMQQMFDPTMDDNYGFGYEGYGGKTRLWQFLLW